MNRNMRPGLLGDKGENSADILRNDRLVDDGGRTAYEGCPRLFLISGRREHDETGVGTRKAEAGGIDKKTGLVDDDLHRMFPQGFEKPGHGGRGIHVAGTAHEGITGTDDRGQFRHSMAVTGRPRRPRGAGLSTCC